MSKANPPATLHVPTLYFDGACPMCSREIALYRRNPGADGVRWVDVTRCDAAELGPDLSREAAMARLHLRHADGSLVSGAAAFAALWRSLPGWSWLGRLFASRVGLWLLDAGYRSFLLMRPLWRPRQGRRAEGVNRASAAKRRPLP